MRKGLVPFITILCMLIPIAVGCQSYSDDPAKMYTQTTAPEIPASETEYSRNTTEPESTYANSTPESTVPSELDAVHQETQPDTFDAPTEPPRGTTPPVTEIPEQTEPTPTEAAPTEPIPTVPQPTEPQPTESKPTEPPVTEPPTTEPPATEPAEVIDLDALVQYGLQYAADTYGYRIYPGTRAGYYPAYTCVFSTMAEGKADIRGCVDDTTRALLAVPGFQIATEIDGVICRTRIDIVIIKQGDKLYLVNVFYG